MLFKKTKEYSEKNYDDFRRVANYLEGKENAKRINCLFPAIIKKFYYYSGTLIEFGVHATSEEKVTDIFYLEVNAEDSMKGNITFSELEKVILS